MNDAINNTCDGINNHRMTDAERILSSEAEFINALDLPADQLPELYMREFEPIFRTALDLSQEQQFDNPKKIYEILEQVSRDILAPILDHEAMDKEAQDIARDLRFFPDYLGSYLAKGMISYTDAAEELIPKLIEGKNRLIAKKKPVAAATNEEHRAKLLIEKLELLELIPVSKAIKIIQADEGNAPNHSMARRAMVKASKISPNVVFLGGWNDGLGSVIRWKKEDSDNFMTWYA